MKNIITLAFLLLLCGPAKAIPPAWLAPSLDSKTCQAVLPLDFSKERHSLFFPGSLVILPQDGREVFYEAFAAAQCEIRIEICVLEDPLILESLQQALYRGVRVLVNVDRNKYETLPIEQLNLAKYLTSAGGQLHLSNPIFPRSFPKVILIDDCYVLIGTACLDTTTFQQYRDYVYVTDRPSIVKSMSQLFENDWLYSSPVGFPYPAFNPTTPITQPNVIIAPVNATNRLVALFQSANESLDVTSELLGNPTLESELAASVSRGVRVRLIAPQIVNGETPQEQALQIQSLSLLKVAGVKVHVTQLPQNAHFPYMHARTAIADEKTVYLGSISLSPNSATYDRGVGLILDDHQVVTTMQRQFDVDYKFKSVTF